MRLFVGPADLVTWCMVVVSYDGQPWSHGHMVLCVQRPCLGLLVQQFCCPGDGMAISQNFSHLLCDFLVGACQERHMVTLSATHTFSTIEPAWPHG